MRNKIRSTWSNSTLFPPNGNPKRSLRDQDLYSPIVYTHDNPKRAGSIEQKLTHILKEVFTSLDRIGPHSSPMS